MQIHRYNLWKNKPKTLIPDEKLFFPSKLKLGNFLKSVRTGANS